MSQREGLSFVGTLCTGCGACASIAPSKIAMGYTGEGYLRPRQAAALTITEESKIRAVCPGIGLRAEMPDAPYDTDWGPIVRARTGHSVDRALRHQASSGGVVSALAQFLLATGRVDAVIQTGASQERPIDNATRESRTVAHVFASAGSRYAPSSPLADLLQRLEQPGRFALVAKPCDIAAVRAYAKLAPEIAERVPYLLTFFCAGIPSRKGSQAILDRLGVAEEDVESFRFRGDGWPGFATARTRDGRVEKMSYAQSWGEILTKHVQFRCKVCPDGSGGFADVACADAWYGDERGYPSFEEAEGRSLVLTRTRKGEELLQAAIAAGFVKADDIATGEIFKMQPYQARRKRLVHSRLAAMRLFGRAVPAFHGLHLWRAAARAGIAANLKSFLGTVRRVATGRLER